MQNEIYNISNIRHEEGRLTCNVSYDAQHDIFKGHFPQQPVVPGVCTMDMIKALLQEALGQQLILRSTGQVKFLQLILPEVQPEASITWQATDQGYNVAASLKANDAFLFKMNGLFEVV